MMRMTMVRGSGLVNSATTGTPNRPMWNVTGTRKRSASSGRSTSVGWRRQHLELSERIRVIPGAVPRVEPVGDDVARLARADQPRDGVQVGAVGPRGQDRPLGRVLAADAVQPHPGQHAVVVRRVGLPAEFAAARQSQPVPRADQRAAVDRARRQVGPQVRTRPGPDVQGAVRAAPRDDLQPADRGAEGPRRMASLAANAYQFPLGLRWDRVQCGVDDGGLRVPIRRSLACPPPARKHLERRAFRPLAT